MKQWFILFFCILGILAIMLEIIFGMPTDLEASYGTSTKNSDLSFDQKASQKMQGIHLVEAREGDRDWELFAESAVGSQDQGNWKLKNVRVKFYKNSISEFTVTGSTGVIDSQSKNIKIIGNVKTASFNQYTFLTSSMIYNSSQRTLISPDKVIMQGPPDPKGTSLELTGVGMVTTIADSKILIEKNVFAKKDLVNGRKMNIKSQSAVFNSQNKEAQFFGQVVLNVDQMNLEGPEVFFDYGGGDEWLKSLRVKGGVRLRYEDKTARSEGLVYETADDKLLLTGHPIIKQNEDELFGEQILLLEGGNKVKVIKPKMKLKEDSYK